MSKRQGNQPPYTYSVSKFMDITNELTALTGAVGGPWRAPSLLVLKALDVDRQICANEAYLSKIFEDFVGCNQLLGTGGSRLSAAERSNLGQEVAVFIAGALSDVNELRRVARHSAPTTSCLQHYESILMQLTKRLERFGRNNREMHKERERRERNPFRLLTAPESASVLSPQSSSSSSSSSSSFSARQHHRTEPPTQKAKLVGFAERYESEVAKPALLRRYDDFVTRQKAALLHEAAHLREVFNEELSLATSAEASVENIAVMLSEFMAILADQSEQVTEVNTYGKTAADTVKQTDAELQLTISRTESHSRNMAILAVCLGLMLLLLDWITP